VKKIIWILLVLIAIPVGLYQSGVIYLVDQTQYSVKTSLGEIRSNATIQNQKWRFGISIPFYSTVYRYPAKVQTQDTPPTLIITRDPQTIELDHVFKWSVDSLTLFHNSVRGVSVAVSRMESMVQDAVKDILGNVDLDSVISGNQEEILQEAIAYANKEAQRIGARILDIRFKKIQLSEENKKRIFERMRNERGTEAIDYRSVGKRDSLVIIAEAEANAKRTRAEAYKEAQIVKGDAEGKAAEIFAKAFSKDPAFYTFWKSLQTYRYSLDTGTTLVLSPSSPLFRYLAGETPSKAKRR
jgi:membrane protease subunit HflC